MISKWTDHLELIEDKTKFKNQILNSREVLERLSQMMEAEGSKYDTLELSPKVFDTPNWENKQAFFNGYKACLKTINNLIDLKKETYDR